MALWSSPFIAWTLWNWDLLKQMVSPKGHEKRGGNHRKSANFVEEDKQQGGAL
jgi:hypothetical protein